MLVVDDRGQPCGSVHRSRLHVQLLLEKTRSRDSAAEFICETLL